MLSCLLGTPLEPDFAGADLLIEEVSEHHYRIDRLMFHVTASANVRGAARIRLGRVSDIPENDPEFGSDEAAIVADWCAPIGHRIRRPRRHRPRRLEPGRAVRAKIS